MISCRKCRKLMAEALYDELSASQKSQFDNHLKVCSDCARQFAQMAHTREVMFQKERFEPGEAFWNNYWETLFPKLPQGQNFRKRSFLRWKGFKNMIHFKPVYAFQFAGAVILIVIGIFIGKYFFGQQSGFNGKSKLTIGSLPKSVVEMRTTRYIERSKVLLLGLVNFDPKTEDVYGLNFPYQKKISQELAHEATWLKTELTSPDQEQLRELVSDLEVILLQIANLESEVDLDGIEIVRSGIDRTGILLKINLEEMQAIDDQPLFIHQQQGDHQKI